MVGTCNTHARDKHILVGNFERKRLLGIYRRRQDNIKTDFKKHGVP